MYPCQTQCLTVAALPWVTCALNWVVGGLKMSVSKYVRIYVWMCDRPLLSLFSAIQSSYGHSRFPETRAALPFVGTNFCLAVFLASGVLTFTLKWSSKCLNLFCCDDTDWRVHWFKWTQMSFISWCKHLFKGAPFPWSVLTSHHGEMFGIARVAKSTASETMAMSEIEH